MTQRNYSRFRQIREQKIILQGGLVKLCVIRFDRQLELLNEQLTHMGELCEVAISRATKALTKRRFEAGSMK